MVCGIGFMSAFLWLPLSSSGVTLPDLQPLLSVNQSYMMVKFVPVFVLYTQEADAVKSLTNNMQAVRTRATGRQIVI